VVYCVVLCWVILFCCVAIDNNINIIIIITIQLTGTVTTTITITTIITITIIISIPIPIIKMLSDTGKFFSHELGRSSKDCISVLVDSD
jgi:hypothetical protein